MAMPKLINRINYDEQYKIDQCVAPVRTGIVFKIDIFGSAAGENDQKDDSNQRNREQYLITDICPGRQRGILVGDLEPGIRNAVRWLYRLCKDASAGHAVSGARGVIASAVGTDHSVYLSFAYIQFL